MKKYLSKGFTLIELLVVIAIIGILAGIVLTSLGTARTKAKDASATASMSSIRSQAEINMTADSKYPSDLLTDATKAGKLIKAAEDQTGHTATKVVATDGLSWAAEIQLAGTSGKYFCVDSNGIAVTSDTSKAITTDKVNCN